MIASYLLVAVSLLVQAPTQKPAAPAAGKPAATSASDRAKAERATTIARRRSRNAQWHSQNQKREADQRDYELKMAPLMMKQQLELARIQALQQQTMMQQDNNNNRQGKSAGNSSDSSYAQMLKSIGSGQDINGIIGN